jgi:hypothetical protein
MADENHWRERRTLQDCIWNAFVQYILKFPCEACVLEWFLFERDRILMIQTDIMSLLDEVVSKLRGVTDFSPLHEGIAEMIEIHLPYRYFPALDLEGSLKIMSAGTTIPAIKRLAQEIIAIKMADTFQACIIECCDEFGQPPQKHCLCELLLYLKSECGFDYNAIGILLGTGDEEYTRTVLALQCRHQQRLIFQYCYDEFLIT